MYTLVRTSDAVLSTILVSVEVRSRCAEFAFSGALSDNTAGDARLARVGSHGSVPVLVLGTSVSLAFSAGDTIVAVHRALGAVLGVVNEVSRKTVFASISVTIAAEVNERSALLGGVYVKATLAAIAGLFVGAINALVTARETDASEAEQTWSAFPALAGVVEKNTNAVLSVALQSVEVVVGTALVVIVANLVHGDSERSP